MFAERGKVRRQLMLPCGRCIGCRIKRVRSWAIRCVHESKCHAANSFVTLTYDDDHFQPSLSYRDFQLFMYRLRKRYGKGIRFFAAGEYGELTLRPHFHVLLFGLSFNDGVKCGENIFASRQLSSLWTSGFSSFGEVNYQSAAYCAKYACKKVTGERAEAHYTRLDVRTGELVRVVPEFARMSLRPGIGYAFFARYWRDFYMARDGIVREGGRTIPTPRYYDQLLEGIDHELRDWKEFERYSRSLDFAKDCTPERLLVRESVALAKQKLQRRSL